MKRNTKGRAGESIELLPDAETLDGFRDRVLARLAELNARPWPEDVRRLIIENGPCPVLLKSVIPALRDHGYTDRLDTLSDATHAVEFYRDGYVYDQRGIALADAVLILMMFSDPHFQMDKPDEYLWRLCYRLAFLAALERDRRRNTDESRSSKGTAGRTAGGWEKQAAQAYATRHARLNSGRLKSKAELSKAIYQHLWDCHELPGRPFKRPIAYMDGSGRPVYTEAALRTIQGWIKPQYDAQK
ncbi:hypothetical protein ACNFCJ_04195 [Pseudomonas sp. NY15364]|uniref:hypothetical protein n=1 Tax=Pseudomonas sp. NY15364 TaxID=3400353 RepID=UPI003A8C4946